VFRPELQTTLLRSPLCGRQDRRPHRGKDSWSSLRLRGCRPRMSDVTHCARTDLAPTQHRPTLACCAIGICPTVTVGSIIYS